MCVTELRRNVRGGLCARVLASLFLVLCSSAGGAERSDTEKRALLKLAGAHPSAAIALVFLGTEVTAGSSGTLYLDGIPSLPALELLLGCCGSAARDDADLVLPRNPYSTAPYFVEVRWASSRRSDQAQLVSIRAQLVNSEGKPLRPTHLLESPVVVVIENGTFSIAQASAASSEGI